MDGYGEQSRFIATTRFSVLLSSRNVICKFALSERKMETNYISTQRHNKTWDVTLVTT